MSTECLGPAPSPEPLKVDAEKTSGAAAAEPFTADAAAALPLPLLPLALAPEPDAAAPPEVAAFGLGAIIIAKAFGAPSFGAIVGSETECVGDTRRGGEKDA